MFWENECAIGMLDKHRYQRESAQLRASLADSPVGCSGPAVEPLTVSPSLSYRQHEP